LDTLIEEPKILVAPSATEPVRESLAALPAGLEADAGDFFDAPVEEIAVSPAPTFSSAVEEPEELQPTEPEAEPRQELPEEPVTVATSEPGETEVAAAPGPETEASEQPPAESQTSEPEPVVAEAAIDPVVEAPQAKASTKPATWVDRWPWAPWAIGSILALVALGLQAVIAFRVELAVLWPRAKPALVSVCDIFGCEVGLPAKVTLVGIEASDLHPDTEHAGRLGLTATLKNRAPFPQQFPHLELTLTDTADKAIARRVMAPAAYLPATTAFAEGMPPNADIMVVVGVDPGEMAASGYRLYLFYP
jgi:hypothetical protein